MDLLIRLVLGAFSLFLFAAPVSAECLSRQVSGLDGKVQTIKILAEATQVADLQAKGYRSASCPTDVAARQSYVNGMCKVAAEGNDAVQARLGQVFGDTPRNLCAAAQRLTGLKYAGAAQSEPQDGAAESGAAENAPPDTVETPSQ